MKSYIASFNEIDKIDFMAVGGKGMNLGELSKIEGIHVPEGFCVTTEAYKKTIENNAELEELVEKLGALESNDRDQISEISKKMRLVIESLRMESRIEDEITRTLSKYGSNEAYAIRSSATAEDLPFAHPLLDSRIPT